MAFRGSLRWSVCLFVSMVNAQSCIPGSPSFLEDWCLATCMEFEGRLTLRLSYANFDYHQWDGAAAMNIEKLCPEVAIAIAYSRAADQVQWARHPDRVREILSTMENYTRQHMDDLDIPTMLSGRYFGAPIFFCMLQLVQQLRLHPEALPVGLGHCHRDPDAQAEASGSAEVNLHELLNSEEVPVPKRIARQFLAADGSVAASTPDLCSIDWSALNFAAADVTRLEDPTEKRRPRLQELTRTAALALQCWRNTHPEEGLLAQLASGCVPLLEVMDRLDRPVVVPIVLPEAPKWSDDPFPVHVLPTLNIESNLVRGLGRLHCDVRFKQFASARWEVPRHPPGRRFSVVEVGAHLGGCTFHVVTHLPPVERRTEDVIRALVVEPFAPAVAAMRRTIWDNGLERIAKVSETIICAEGERFVHHQHRDPDLPWLHQPYWIPAAPSDPEASDGLDEEVALSENRQCRGLGEVLSERGFRIVDLLRIHVVGAEMSVLQTVIPRLRSGQIRALAVAIFGFTYQNARRQDSVAIARLLLEAGMTIDYEGLRGRDAMERLAHNVAKGTSTLVAWHGSYYLNRAGEGRSNETMVEVE